MANDKARKPSGAGSAGAGEHEDGGKGKPRGKSSMMLVVVGMLSLAAGGAGAGWFYFKGMHANAGTVDTPKRAAPPAFVTMESFTVNLADREHFLQIGFSYEVTGSDTTDAMKIHMPILRSKILLLLASKSSQDLGSVDGKNRLAEELVARARETLPLTAPDKGVSGVHFSAFVIQ